ncbi:hypothetical protein AKO1_006462 [Acrasis kona]|uniref:DJ-1/PfpI domain-containing protein n=1 Tax=Acrasis kona TaxID=1008807 RepID=A0AAW2ZK94_9EUKA
MKNVALLIYDQFEIVDASGPLDVFIKACRIENTFNVFTLAAKKDFVYAEKSSYSIMPTYSIHNCPLEPDVIIIPGSELNNIRNNIIPSEDFKYLVIPWLIETKKQRPQTIIMSVCTGAFILAETGLLENKPCTTHKDHYDDLENRLPNSAVVKGVRYVDVTGRGDIITTSGITSGIDGALYLVAKMINKKTANKVSSMMQFDAKDSNEVSVFTFGIGLISVALLTFFISRRF